MTYEQWTTARLRDPNNNGRITLREAWHARDAEIAVLEAKLERVKGLMERCKKSANDPKLLTRSTYKWFASDLQAALEGKE